MSPDTEREKILGRVREALSERAPHPGTTHDTRPSAPTLTLSGGPREWLPAVGSTPDEVFAAFQRVARDLKAEVILAADVTAMTTAAKALRDAGGWTSFATHKGGLTDQVAAAVGITAVYTDNGYDTAALEQASVGITECDALIAQTGSVLITARSAGGRAISVLPPHHIVLARRSQLLPDLPEAFALLRRKYGKDYPSFISLITGPSRTGDIERILVLGAHGPKRLTIIVLENEP